jgi:hypothetical protein
MRAIALDITSAPGYGYSGDIRSSGNLDDRVHLYRSGNNAGKCRTVIGYAVARGSTVLGSKMACLLIRWNRTTEIQGRHFLSLGECAAEQAFPQSPRARNWKHFPLSIADLTCGNASAARVSSLQCKDNIGIVLGR